VYIAAALLTAVFTARLIKDIAAKRKAKKEADKSPS
jgi:hypothetical protein